MFYPHKCYTQRCEEKLFTYTESGRVCDLLDAKLELLILKLDKVRTSNAKKKIAPGTPEEKSLAYTIKQLRNARSKVYANTEKS